MSTTFWEHIDWSDSADDSFSLGLSRVKSEFWNGWQKAQHKVIPSCDEERFSRAHTKSCAEETLQTLFLMLIGFVSCSHRRWAEGIPFGVTS